jgi:AcrR family transcriptional regulator
MAKLPVKRRRRRYHHGDLRRGLIEAALKLIAERGPGGFTLREAARRAGVTHTAPYRHYASREALLVAVAEDGFTGLRDALEMAAKRTGEDPLAKLEAMGTAYVRYAVTHPSHFRVMFGGVIVDKFSHSRLAEATAAAFTPLVETIAACQAAGYVRDGIASDLAVPLLSTAHGFAWLLLDGQGSAAATDVATIETRTAQVTDAVYEGLRARRHT